MLSLALIGSALLMGLAGSVHCVAMCAAPCAAVTGGEGRNTLVFQLGRLLGYSALGAAAASSVGLLWQLEQAAAWLRPLWLLLHLAVLALGVWLLWRGEQPLWMQRRFIPLTPLRTAGPPAGAAAQVIPIVPAASGPSRPIPSRAGLSRAAADAGKAAWRPALVGVAWAAWPCGLLQAALLVAALASGPVHGAAVMAAFAVGSSPGLVAGPWLLRQLSHRAIRRAGARAAAVPQPSVGGVLAPAASGANGLRWATRLSGLLLAGAALWALGHGAWQQIRAYCG